MRWRQRQRARQRGDGDVWSLQGAVDARLTMVLPVTDSQGAIDKEQQCPNGDALIMLDMKAKKSILEGEHSISWKRGQDNI